MALWMGSKKDYIILESNMEISENILHSLNKTLFGYPYQMNGEMLNYIHNAFLKTEEAKKFDCNFQESIEYAAAKGLFESKDTNKVKLWQYHQDLLRHIDIDETGVKKEDYIAASFTLAYDVVKRFNKEYPHYILVAQILAQTESSPAPDPIGEINPGVRVSFYFYNPCADGDDLNWYNNLPVHLKKTMYWRFSTFDIPLLEWMIKMVKKNGQFY